MPLEKPISQRHYSEDIGNRFFITIPSRKNWFLIPVLGIWLAGWAFGEITAGSVILSGLFGNKGFSGVPILFLLVWIIFWTIGGAFAAYALFWQLVGREEIEVTSYSLMISQVVAMFRRSKEYAIEHVKDLRISPMGVNEMHKWSRSLAVYGIGGGVIVFDYGAGTIRFGSGIDEAEGKQIIAEIQQKFPQYKK